MPISRELSILLEHAGLPRWARVIYIFLLDHGPSTRQRLLRTCPVPPEELELSLQLLQALFLVQRQLFRDSERFYASHPNISWRWQELDLVWREQLTLGAVEEAPALMVAQAEERRRLLPQIRELCSTAYKAWPYTSVTIPRGRAYGDAHEYAYACAEAILLAEDRIISLHRPPSLPHVAIFWAAILDRRKEGIDYTRCVTLEEIFKHGLDVVTRDICEVGIRTFVVEADRIWKSLYLVDDRYLLAKSARQPPVGYLIRNSEIIERHVRRAERVIAQSLDSDRVMGFCSQWLEEVGDAVGREHGNEARDLVDRVGRAGIFCDLDAKGQRLAQSLKAAGIFRSFGGAKFAVTEPSEAVLESLR